MKAIYFYPQTIYFIIYIYLFKKNLDISVVLVKGF